MKIIVTIESCIDCAHLGHSGAFTPGGAKDICQHDDAIECAAKAKNIKKPKDYIQHLNDSKSFLHGEAVNYIHWKHRVIPDVKKIPAWCPLKKGKAY